jgi:hypothetical protein
MVLARYNRRDGGHRVLWVRGRLDDALFTYQTDDRVRVMVARFGSPDLLQSLSPLRAIYDQHRNDMGLVKGLPFVPADPRASPFIGAWGVFALEVFVESSSGALTRLYGQ